MSVNLSALTKYVDEQRLPLISKLGLEAKTAKEFEIQTGIRNEAAINLLGVTGSFSDGTACGWNDNGSVKFTQRNIKVGNVKFEASICQNAMAEYWMNYELAVSARRKNLPFEEYITGKFVDMVNEKVEAGLWAGDTTSGSGDLAYFDGIATLLAATEGASEGVVVATAATSATAWEQVKAVYNAIPDAVLTKSVIYVNYAKFRQLVDELTAKNLTHYAPTVDAPMEITLPGTSTLVKAMPGLSGVDKIFSLVPEHTFYGCNLADDKDEYTIWYSVDNDAYRVRIAFCAGVQVAYPSECVELAY